MWTTSMLFFQVVLVLGYAYSHAISGRVSLRAQWILHSGLLLIAVLFLPIVPCENFKPTSGDMPTYKVLTLLTAVVGVPFFILSATAPLIQKWYSNTIGGQPYRLYAVSNAGSLLALISYPLLIEQYATRAVQANYWAILFLVFVALMVWVGRLALSIESVSGSGKKNSRGAVMYNVPQPDEDSTSGPLMVLIWLLLGALPSTALLATTNLLTSEVASNPFLWVLPLSLYLITFILCFESDRWYKRGVCFPALLLSVIFTLPVFKSGTNADLSTQIISFCAAGFFIALCCHGELAKLKPPAAYLTLFYLMISIGGAFGGVFVALVAPVLFNDIYEFHLSAGGAIVLTVLVVSLQISKVSPDSSNAANPGVSGDRTGATKRSTKISFYFRVLPLAVYLFVSIFSLVMVFESVYDRIQKSQLESMVELYRNDYGVIKVQDYETQFHEKDEPFRMMHHGRTIHGGQSLIPENQDTPWSYYRATGGFGRAVIYFQNSNDYSELRIGAIGLGAGEIAAWGRPGDSISFYEINPAVIRIAKQHFTYLDNSKADISISLGDARFTLERQIEHGQEQNFNLLLADAFSGDSVPTHLLTVEAFQSYFQALKPDGILVVHVSNKFVKLEGIVKNNADMLGLRSIKIEDPVTSTRFVLVGSNDRFFSSDIIRELGTEDFGSDSSLSWSDDFSSIYPLIRWTRESASH